MKITDLFINQEVSIQFRWDEQTIQFQSRVLEKDAEEVFTKPYFVQGSELEINVSQAKGVICNIYANDPDTRQRISWKNVDLTTVNRNGEIMYCIKTSGFNQLANLDDRRNHDRFVVQTKGQLIMRETEETMDILVHDVSDVGVSFYAPISFNPSTHHLIVTYSDTVAGKVFPVRVECDIARMTKKAGNMLVGCKVSKEDKDFKMYCFMKRIKEKNKMNDSK